MKVLVCGSRDWTDGEAILRELVALDANLRAFCDDQIEVVINGASRGADQLATRAAKELGISYEEYPADWKRFGKGAGPIRNKEMLIASNPDLVLAFSDDIKNSRGTKHMVEIAEKEGITVKVFPGREKEENLPKVLDHRKYVVSFKIIDRDGAVHYAQVKDGALHLKQKMELDVAPGCQGHLEAWSTYDITIEGIYIP